jgi:hypothetical protein
MEQQDYLKRQIDQLAQALGKMLSGIIGLKNKGQVNEGIEIAYQTLKSEIDLDIQKLVDGPNDFIDTLITEKNFNNESLEKLADILLTIADNRQDDNTKTLYKKCLTIYEYLEKAENVYSIDRQWKMERIKNVLITSTILRQGI